MTRPLAWLSRSGSRVATSVAVNSLTPYAHVTMLLDGDRVRIVWPRLLLGIVPTGRRDVEFRLGDLQRLRLRVVVMPGRLLVAAAGWLLVVLADLPAAIAIGLSLFPLYFSVLSFVLALELRSSLGRERIPVCFFQRGRSAAFVDAVDRARLEREDGP
jgi:hypothetical protein